MQDIALILEVPHYAYAGMNALVVPALRVHSIRTKDLQLTSVDSGRQRGNYAAILIFKKLAHGSGEDKQRRARMTEAQRFHVTVQFGAVSLEIFAVHDRSGVNRNQGAEYLT